ncbi:penicillin-binding protein 2 [Geomicrobium sp. JCM 19039]|uniref:peptidoglycan D,D-transpeptidase FtsI family protein n=1 Tax=Geomicrobium sp. JCM 19039 TaxID=1460636 RepID=UPI00045F2185|nr:penicillin-binding transpeptidase domain-containing protein [Geomicrobium sp. JCM 19039]GAK14660.1 cell division protein FtsI [Geomicrobium sp. JCM 19039]
MVRERRKNHIPFRLNVLFFGVFILFSVLILRLGYIQIVQGESYDLMLSSQEEQTANVDAPRGLMVDRYNNVVVDNDLQLSLTYTNTPNNDLERYEIAHELIHYLNIEDDDIESVNAREWKDYLLYKATIEESGDLQDRVDSLVTSEEANELEDDEFYQLQLDRLDENEIMESFDRNEQEAVVIWAEMLSGYNYSPNRIARGLTQEEAHQMAEILHDLPGTDIMRDAERIYPYGESFRRYFGGTGSIPAEQIENYVGHGYERSDVVGTSFLESYYEDVLRGEKAIMRTDAEGNVTTDPGRRGNDLMLTIDMALQQEVEEIINQEMTGNFIADREAYVVMMEPDTGEVLTVAGYNGENLGATTSTFEMGSTVKPATVLAGYHHGVIDHGTVVNDSPITSIPGTPTIRSWQTMGYVNDVDAIRRSSNIYMTEIAMRLADYNMSTNQWGSLGYSYQALRNHYAQFGLGTETGIDLPSESSGYIGNSQSGLVLFLSFGQFDTYTPMQLAQMSATVANDGKRMKPRLVKEIREPSTDEEYDQGSVVRQFEPEVLNTVDNSTADFERIQLGMRQVVATGGQGGGTAYSYFNGSNQVSYEAAAKTGTAEVTAQNGVQGNNQTMIAYAPYDDPEVAIAVVVPNVALDSSGGRQGIANHIARESLSAYFDLEEDRVNPEREEDEAEIYADPEEGVEDDIE